MDIDRSDMWAALDEVEAATGRLVTAVAGLSEAELRAPSLLPGWTRAHVITHVARNADSHGNLLEWARTGIRRPQYESLEQRNRDIEAGISRTAAELAEDVRVSGERLSRAARDLPEASWNAIVEAATGWPHPAWYTVYRRWREVEVHHSDLGIGHSHLDWSDAYVRWELADTLGGLRERGDLSGWRIRVTGLGPEPAPAGTADGVRADETADGPADEAADGPADEAADGPADEAADGPEGEIAGTARDVLAWLAGRTDGTALLIAGPGGSPVPPPVPPVWPQAPAAIR